MSENADRLARRIARGDRSKATAEAYLRAIGGEAPLEPWSTIEWHPPGGGAWFLLLHPRPKHRDDRSQLRALEVPFEVVVGKGRADPGAEVVGRGTAYYQEYEHYKRHGMMADEVVWDGPDKRPCHCSTGFDRNCLMHGDEPTVEDVLTGDVDDPEDSAYFDVWHWVNRWRGE